MSDWHFWYNGVIYSHPVQQLHREEIEDMIGFYFIEVAYVFPKLHTVLLHSRDLAKN